MSLATDPSRRRKPYRLKPMADRFWAKVQRGEAGECWPWTGARQIGKHRYGMFRTGGRLNPKTLKAHRVAWELTNGPIPEGLCVCHHCDNPPCCNTAHLFLGTNDDNVADKEAKHRSIHGIKNPNSKLTPDAARTIIEMAKTGLPDRIAAEKFGVTVGVVRRVRAGKGWIRETGGVRVQRQLLPEQVREIRGRHLSGESARSIAALFRISDTTVRNIANGLIWQGVK